jgi:hypothetical protein
LTYPSASPCAESGRGIAVPPRIGCSVSAAAPPVRVNDTSLIGREDMAPMHLHE